MRARSTFYAFGLLLFFGPRSAPVADPGFVDWTRAQQEESQLAKILAALEERAFKVRVIVANGPGLYRRDLADARRRVDEAREILGGEKLKAATEALAARKVDVESKIAPSGRTVRLRGRGDAASGLVALRLLGPAVWNLSTLHLQGGTWEATATIPDPSRLPPSRDPASGPRHLRQPPQLPERSKLSSSRSTELRRKIAEVERELDSLDSGMVEVGDLDFAARCVESDLRELGERNALHAITLLSALAPQLGSKIRSVQFSGRSAFLELATETGSPLVLPPALRQDYLVLEDPLRVVPRAPPSSMERLVPRRTCYPFDPMP